MPQEILFIVSGQYSATARKRSNSTAIAARTQFDQLQTNMNAAFHVAVCVKS